MEPRRSALTALLALLLGGALLAVSTGLGPWGALAWLAPVPMLRYAYGAAAQGRPWWRGAAIAGGAFLLGQGPVLWAYGGVLPPVELAVSLLLLAAAFGLVAAASAASLRRLPAVLGILSFPALWTTWELALAHLGPHGTAGSLAYSQAGFLPVLQVASVAGLPAITFLLLWVASALSWCSLAWRERRELARVGVPPLLVLLAVVGGGAWRLASASIPGPPQAGFRVKVGLASTDRTVAAFATTNESEALATYEAYGRRIRALGARGAEWIVLPEKLAPIRPGWESAARGLLSRAASTARSNVLAGLNAWGVQGERRNVALWLTPDGRVAGSYSKRHLVPGLEAAYERGSARLIANGVVGVAICKDMDFPALGRDLARHGARLVLVPAWDFVRDGRLHARMAVVRGVESGFAVARSAQQGLLTASDAYGRILAEAPSSRLDETLLLAEIPLGPGATFYARHGDLFGGACALAAAAILLLLVLRRAPRPQPL